MLARIVLFQPKQRCVGFLRENQCVKLGVRMRADELKELLCGFIAGDGFEACVGETTCQHLGWFQMLERCDWYVRRHTRGSQHGMGLRVFLYAARIASSYAASG